jgi:putative DNA primase/helicase
MTLPDGLLSAMAAHGLDPHKLPSSEPGRIARFRVRGDKPGSRNGWAVHHTDWGTFGSWKTGEFHTWFDRDEHTLTPAELAQRAHARREALQVQRQEQAKAHAAASAKAVHLWGLARPATDAHPYLISKGVHAYGFKLLHDALVIPARDAQGKLHTLQFIQPDGTKRFLTGGRIRGCYCAIGEPQDTILIAEGIATAATLFEATGYAVAAAFNCGNLEPVALALRQKFPSLRLVLCADNDTNTPGNPGLSHATAAAEAVGAWLAVPLFDGGTNGQ